MKSGSTIEHRGCELLQPEENEQIFRLIGNRCQCMAAGVVQLYLTEPPFHREWIKKSTGIMTLIRDYRRRSFFFRLYCLQKKVMLWEHEIYNTMSYNAPMSYFHTFEAEDCMAAFNFASETEAIKLRNILLERQDAKRQRRQEKRSRMEMDGQHGVTLPRKSQSSTLSFGYTPGSTTNLTNGTPSSFGVNRSVSSSSMYKVKTKKHEKYSKRKFTKADIGLPSNFRHVAHMGWDANSKGLELDSIDPEMKQFFDKVGVSQRELSEPETREFIYDFIAKHGGLKAVHNEIVPSSSFESSSQPPPLPYGSDHPPPIPARTMPVSPHPPSNSHQARCAPSISRSAAHAPPTLPGAPPAHRPLPSRPPAPSISPAPQLPPPPPPPPPPPSRGNSGVAAPPPPPLPNLTDSDSETSDSNARNNNNNGDVFDPRSVLMESIRSGTTLKKVSKEEARPSPTVDSRGDLLNQIRQGIELKPVSSEPKPNRTPLSEGGLAGALKRALIERSRAIHSDSDDSTSDTSDDEEWDD